MFVTNHAALKIGKCLVISDLHMGAEYDILKSGIRVRQVEDLIERTMDLLKLTGARDLILLGDVKHNVPFSRRVEEISVPLYLEAVSRKAHVTIIPGNHDGSIAELCPHRVDISETPGILVGKYGLMHGHTKIPKNLEKASFLVIGHNHPMFMFEDDGGGRFYRQVWVRGRMHDGRELIVMPAFSRLVGGMALNNKKGDFSLMGPVARHMDMKSSMLYLLDGTLLGKLGDIK